MMDIDYNRMSIDDIKTKYQIRPELEIVDSTLYKKQIQSESFPESKKQGQLRVVKIHERMLNTVIEQNKNNVLHIVISHGFIIDEMGILLETIYGEGSHNE